jgi:SAM-dependent methyltransferase
MFTKKLADLEKSPMAPLLSEHDLADHVASLREHLSLDNSPEARAELTDSELVQTSSQHAWFQRLAIPGTRCFTTSDHGRLQISNPGWLNTLGDALTPEEGFILRPMPKWAYLKPLFPDLQGKSVLEIGCNNGYFCFEFLEMGARKVTGVELLEAFALAGQWMIEARTARNIKILTGDALVDLEIPKHDVVFMSEVHAHFVDPLFGILRAVNLAKETLVIDGAALPGAGYEIDLGADIDPVTGEPLYHAWIMSDGLMLTYLFLCGIPPEKVKRYVAPWHNHILYVIDTREVAAYRQTRETAFQAILKKHLNSKVTESPARRSQVPDRKTAPG